MLPAATTILRYLCAVAFICGAANARQIRINRYATEIDNGDNELVVNATVREVKPTPYPAAGFRPGRAFNLPGEQADTRNQVAVDVDADAEGSGLSTTTNENGNDLSGATIGAPVVESTTLAADYDYDDDDDVAAVAARVGKAPYPAAGYRPSVAFNLPGETQVNFTSNEEIATTLAPNVSFGLPGESQVSFRSAEEATTTLAPNVDFGLPAESQINFRPNEQITTTLVPTDEQTTDAVPTTTVETPTTAVPLAPFNVPLAPFTTTTSTTSTPPTTTKATARPQTQRKAPYPAAGYRPSRVFLLPGEFLATNDTQLAPSTPDNAKHPVCGSNDDPIAPKPAPGTKEDPDSEHVSVAAAFGPAIVSAPVPRAIPLSVRPVLAIRSQALITQPLFFAARSRPAVAYSTQVQTW